MRIGGLEVKEQLLEKIANREAKIGVIGLGYVGLPLVHEFSTQGFNVTGFDIDDRKVDALNAGKSYIGHIPSEQIAGHINSGRFKATSDFDKMVETDCLIICVPTPLTEMKEPDMSYIEGTAKSIAQRLRKGHLVALESTTYPGTTREVVLPILTAGKDLEVGKDFFLAFSPEREDPANKSFSTRTIPKVVGGLTPACTELADALYSSIVERTVVVSSAEIAESAKLLENIYRSVNIALVNELKMLFSRMGIDVWEVIRAASTKPFGYHAFYPGPGLGGHCIPIDPFYLSWKAKEFDFATRFIELAGEINTSIPYYVVDRVALALNEKQKSVKGSKVFVLGVAYKPDVDDIRESPAMRIIELLMERGAVVTYNDPFIPKLPMMRKYNIPKTSVDFTADSLSGADCVLIVTDHALYKKEAQFIVDNSSVVVDTRNATSGASENRDKIVSA
ncbi:MAG: nucleotide sugar dehydrogenase [Candidatus Coatesbacteria bacterium]|nr:nucleotide sugar dehydrogenase [Candidatus Coatesbacteria bacterium]